MIRVPWIIAAGVVLTAGIRLGGQAPHTGHAAALTSIPSDVLQRPAPIREGIGIAREPVTTKSEAAQRFYDQGLAQLHSFMWIEAARSFHAALRLDPKLAMAHLGLSCAFGELGSLEGARKAIVAARTLAANVSRPEQVRIALRQQQLDVFEGVAEPAAYRAALDRMLAEFPDNVELLLLRGHVEQQPAGGPATTIDGGAVPFFNRALALVPDQFPAHHYLIHAHEDAGRIEQALQHADTYVRMAPAVPHAHHMRGHGLRRVGRTKEAVVEFRTAEDLEAAYFAAEKMPPAYDWHRHHNWSLLAASYRSLGQMRAARAVLERAFGLPAPLLTEELTKREWPAFLLDRRAPDAALAAARRLVGHGSGLVRAAGHMAAAHALMALARVQPAAADIDAALRELRAAGPMAGELAPALRLLQGEFFLRSSAPDKGRAMIRQGVAELRARVGPDPWTSTLFNLEAAARAARESGDWLLASELAREMRLHDATYAGGHYAMALAAEQRGDRAAAAQAYAEAATRWADADADLPELTHARTRAAALSARQP